MNTVKPVFGALYFANFASLASPRK